MTTTSSTPTTALNVVRVASASRTLIVLFALLVGLTLGHLYGSDRMAQEYRSGYDAGVRDTEMCMHRPVIYYQVVTVIPTIHIHDHHIWVLP